MKKQIKQFLSISVLVIGIAIAFLKVLSIHPHYLAEIDECLQKNHFQGFALIAQNGKILFNQGYGFAEEYEFLLFVLNCFRA